MLLNFMFLNRKFKLINLIKLLNYKFIKNLKICFQLVNYGFIQ